MNARGPTARREAAPQARLWVRVVTPSGAPIGPGMIALLKAVQAEGSIAAAARALSMSYRRAWLLLEQIKATLGAPVIETSIGGAEKGGAKLSATGQRLIALYDRIERGANDAVSTELQSFFRDLAD